MDKGTDRPSPCPHSVRYLIWDLCVGSPGADRLLRSPIVELQGTIKSFLAEACLFKIAHIAVKLG